MDIIYSYYGGNELSINQLAVIVQIWSVSRDSNWEEEKKKIGVISEWCDALEAADENICLKYSLNWWLHGLIANYVSAN